jgi:preprotein translocase subunit SecA
MEEAQDQLHNLELNGTPQHATDPRAIYRKFGESDQGFQVLQELRRRLADHPHGEPITDRGVLRTLRELQKKVEVEGEAIRREVLRYDVVVDHQRRTIYGWRQAILGQEPGETIALLKQMVADLGRDLEAEASDDSDLTDDVREEVGTFLREVLGTGAEGGDARPVESATQLCALIEKRFSELEAAVGAEELAGVAGQVMLATIDETWTEHLGDLERADDAVRLRGYAQLDPLLEFKREAHNLYQALLARVRAQIIARLLSIRQASGD